MGKWPADPTRVGIIADNKSVIGANLQKEGYIFLFLFFLPAFVAFVASVAFGGVWLLWLYHALPIYLSIYSNLT